MRSSGEATGSVWRIDREKTWPPAGQVSAPISPSLYQTVETCWLRGTFGASDAYPRRSNPYARLGTAFHDVLEILPTLLANARASSPKEVRRQAVAEFARAAGRERERALNNPREAGDPWPEKHEQRMEVRAALAAGQMAAASGADERSAAAAPGGRQPRPRATLEKMLVSEDGLLKGKPDRVEEGPRGTVIVDYKTGALSNPESLERYERQCLFYAWLWHERHGVWPVAYRLVNPLTDEEHGGRVDPGAAEELAADARSLAARLEDPPEASEQASPGGHCAVCEFRPWCEPFWMKEARPAFEVPAPKGRTRVSVQGIVREARSAPSGRGPQALVEMRVEGGFATLQAPLEGFPHLEALGGGDRLRVLDASVSTEDKGWLRADGRTEVFVVVR